MEITYDSKADALNITFNKGKVAKTVELAPEMNLDLDKKKQATLFGNNRRQRKNGQKEGKRNFNEEFNPGLILSG